MKLTSKQLRQVVQETISGNIPSTLKEYDDYESQWDAADAFNKQQEYEARQKAAAAAEEQRRQQTSALQKIQAEIKEYQGYQKDPDNQDPESQQVIKAHLQELMQELPAIKTIQQQINQVTQTMQSADPATKIRYKSQLKTLQGQMEAETKKLDQMDATADTNLKESKNIRVLKNMIREAVKETIWSK